MKKYTFLFLSLFLTTAIIAQTAHWAGPTPHPKAGDGKLEVNVLKADENGLFRARITEWSVSSTEVVIDEFDEKYEFVKTHEVSLIGQVKEFRSYEEFAVINGKNYLFTSSFSKPEKKFKLYVREIDLKGEPVGDERLLTSMPAEKLFRTGEFKINVSPNGNHVVILHQLPFVKKQNEKAIIKIYDNSLKEVKKKQVTLPYDWKRGPANTPLINNEGQVFILRTVFEKVFGIKYDVFYYNQSEGKLKQHNLTLESGKEIHECAFEFDNDGNLVVAGFYTDNVKTSRDAMGAYMLRFDAQSGEQLAKGISDFEGKFPDLAPLKCIVSTEGIIMIGEITTVDSKIISQSGTDIKYDKTYVNKDIFLTQFGFDGEVLAGHKIEKANQSRNDRGYLNSAVVLPHNGLVKLLFTDNAIKYDDAFKDKPTYRYVIMATLEADGNLSTKVLTDLGEGFYTSSFKLCTNEFYTLPNDMILLKAASSAEFKFGAVKF